MISSGWLLAECLVGAAAILAWPATVTPRRRVVSRVAGVVKPRFRLDASATVGQLWGWAVRRPRRAVLVSGVAAAVLGWLVAGLVAAAVVGGYTALGTRVVLSGATGRRAAAAHARNLDDLCALAADLRAGLPPPISSSGLPSAGDSSVAQSRPGIGSVDVRLGRLIDAVWRLAEQTGAPAADLIERIEADARAGDRARVSAAAQAAGATATAWLLAGLPVGGIALGYAIGVDPLRVLLHSPLGAACAVTAVILQAAGLAWTDRLARARPR